MINNKKKMKKINLKDRNALSHNALTNFINRKSVCVLSTTAFYKL